MSTKYAQKTLFVIFFAFFLVFRLTKRRSHDIVMVLMRKIAHGLCSGASGILTEYCAYVAQLVEHILGKDEVTSSTLVIGSIFDNSKH